MMQELYEVNKKFYKDIEQEFGAFSFGKYEWLSLHLRYLVHYMTKYDIQNRECFTAYQPTTIGFPTVFTSYVFLTT